MTVTETAVPSSWKICVMPTLRAEYTFAIALFPSIRLHKRTGNLQARSQRAQLLLPIAHFRLITCVQNLPTH